MNHDENLYFHTGTIDSFTNYCNSFFSINNAVVGRLVTFDYDPCVKEVIILEALCFSINLKISGSNTKILFFYNLFV